MNNIIQTFLQKQHIASICGVHTNSTPFIFSCFYVVQYNVLLFKSSPHSNHIESMHLHAAIAGTVIANQKNALRFSGAQFEGHFLGSAKVHGIETSSYYAQHPLAVAIPGEIYAVELTGIKLTEHTLGVMKKHVWMAHMELKQSD